MSQRTGPVSLAREQALPLLEALAPLFPDAGLRRGITVAVSGRGSLSLGVALGSAASAAGSWVAVVAEQLPNVESIFELGVRAERLVMVRPQLASSWGTTVATLLDGVEVIVLVRPPALASALQRRLASRARERGAVLVVTGDAAAFEPEVRLTVVDEGWVGLGRGHGYLQARQLTVEATGRRAASRPRRCLLNFPDVGGAISAVPAERGSGPSRVSQPASQVG
ncbi:MAG: hypothetical protein JWL70_2097 [Acidimicrobiia bacterium]|nr:hypothetical protein [Acidimicrobiia bacterium]